MNARPIGFSFLRFGAVRMLTTSFRSFVGSPPLIAAFARVRASVARAIG
jgi:hypothetical protein